MGTAAGGPFQAASATMGFLVLEECVLALRAVPRRRAAFPLAALPWGRVARRRLTARQKLIEHASPVTESPPWQASQGGSRRVLKSVPRPNDKHYARERPGACVSSARAFPPRAFPKLGGSSPPFG